MTPGFWAALLAYGLWGLFPLYFQWTRVASAMEVVAHRVVWSALLLFVVLVLTRRLLAMRQWLRAPILGRMACAAALISINWSTYVWAVTNGHTVDASLGYFLLPLVNVALGVALLGERLVSLQWAGVASAMLGVGYLAWASPQFPWVAVTLALSFSFYGLLKKKTPLPPLEGMLIETLLMLTPALVALAWIAWRSMLVFNHHSLATDAALIGSGLVTVVPLAAFAYAAQRLPLATLGMMQYITPTMVFLIGVLLQKEPMDAHRLLGFVAVWVGLALFTVAAGWRRWAVQSKAKMPSGA